MAEESDDFGLGADLEIEHDGSGAPPPAPRGAPPRSAAGDSLFSGEDDDLDAGAEVRVASLGVGLGAGLGDLDIDHGPAPPRGAPPPRPSAPGPPSRGSRRGSDADLFGDSGGPGGDSGGLGLDLSGGALGGDIDIDHDDGGGPPAPRQRPPPRPAAPPPPSRGRRSGAASAASGDLFSDDDDGDGGISLGGGRSRGGRSSGLGGDDDLGLGLGGGDIEIDHDDGPGGRGPPPLPPRPPAPRPPAGATNFTDPEISLMGDDDGLDALLGGGGGSQRSRAGSSSGLPPAPPPLQPSGAGPSLSVSRGGQGSRGGSRAGSTFGGDSLGGGGGGGGGGGTSGLGGDDEELADLLGERPRPPAPAARAPTSAQSSQRRISFQEPPVQPAPPARRPPGPSPGPEDDFGDTGDDDFGLGAEGAGPGGRGSSRGSSGRGFGLAADMDEDDPDREVARIASQRGSAAQSRSAYDSGGDLSFSTSGGVGAPPPRPPPPRPQAPAPGPPLGLQRVAQEDSGYGEDSFDSPVPPRRPGPPLPGPPLRGSPGGHYDDDYDDDYGDEYGSGGGYGTPPPHTRGRLPGPGAYDDEYYSDEDPYDDFADDLSWDGEVRVHGTHGAYNRRPGSDAMPRTRGAAATGGRRRPLSAMAPRERQAAMMEDMMGRHPSTWDIREVATWIDFIGMGQYRSKFVHHSIDGTLLLSLGEAELARDMRILPLGHRRALLGAIAELKEAAASMEAARAEKGLPPSAPGADGKPKNEAARVAELRRRAEEREGTRRPASAGAAVIPPEPYLGPAVGKITVYEQRAKLLYQLDRARHRAAQHQAIIEQLRDNKALTEQQMVDLRGKLKDLELKHKDGLGAELGARRGSPGAHGGGTAAMADAELGAAVPWQPVGKGSHVANPNPQRYARPGDDPALDNTFIPRTTRLHEVPEGPRDIVAKALASRVPFWKRMDFEFDRMKKEREAKEEARRKRRERMGFAKRGGGEGEDDEQAKSKYWNNYWVPGSTKNASAHKHFRKGSENEELRQYRGFTKDKTRLSRWFMRFVDGEETEGDLVLERLINRMIKALAKTQAQLDTEMEENGGDTPSITFDKKIRQYFKERGYKFDTVVSKTIMVRAHGTRAPGPNRPDTNMYDFEEVEQYYPDYLRKKVQGANDDGGGGDDDARMVPQRTTWKRLKAMYYMDRQNKIRAAISMVKMSQFVQRHGAKWPRERDRDSDSKAVWVPNSRAGALHQVDGRDRTFNNFGQEQISLHAKLKKALGPPQPVTFAMKMKQQEEVEAKADAVYGAMGWPHSSGDDALGPPQEPMLQEPGEEGGGFGMGGEDSLGLVGLDGEPGVGAGLGGEEFGLGGEAAAEGGAPAPRRRAGGQRARAAAPRLDFWQALDGLISRASELRHQQDEWFEARQRCRERGYGWEELSEDPPRAEEMDWGGDPLMSMQQRAMERQRQDWLLAWEKGRRVRDRRAARLQQQGYTQDDIEQRLGPQIEAGEVEDHVHNYLTRYVTLLARMKPHDLARIRDELTGTKKKMAVYRTIMNQEFLEESDAKAALRESKLRATYEQLSARRRGSRVLSEQQVDNLVSRIEVDVRRREGRQRDLLTRKEEEELNAMTPWYVVHPPRPPSRGPSRTASPDRPRSRSRSPGASAASTPRPVSAPRPTPGRPAPEWVPGQVVFGSRTPRPVGMARRPAGRSGRTPEGGSLLDSAVLPGGGAAGDLPARSPSGGGASSRPRTSSTSTPSRPRPSTPTRSTHSAAPPSPRPRSAAPPGGAGAALGRGRPGSARPASPAGRGRGGAASSPKPPGTRVGFASPPPSRGGAGPGSGPPARRGLMDGDTTSGTSASPSPDRPRPGSAAGAPGGARRGLADSDGSPSPPRARAQPPAPPQQQQQEPHPPGSARSSASGAAAAAGRPGSAAGGSARGSTTGAARGSTSGAAGGGLAGERSGGSGVGVGVGGAGSAPGSRRASQASGISAAGSAGRGAAAGGGSRPGSGAQQPPSRPLSQQASASSGLGLAAGAGGGGGGGGGGGSARPSASGSAAGGGGGSAAGSRRPSVAGQPSQLSVGPGPSAPASRRESTVGAPGAAPPPPTAQKSSSSGTTTPGAPRSPLSRSSASHSPAPGLSPAAQSPASHSPAAASPPASPPSQQPSHRGSASGGAAPPAPPPAPQRSGSIRSGRGSASGGPGGGGMSGGASRVDVLAEEDEYELDLEPDDEAAGVEVGGDEGDLDLGEVDLGGDEDEF